MDDRLEWRAFEKVGSIYFAMASSLIYFYESQSRSETFYTIPTFPEAQVVSATNMFAQSSC